MGDSSVTVVILDNGLQMKKNVLLAYEVVIRSSN